MDETTKKALEARGYEIGDYGDFLGLTDDERRAVERRVSVQRKTEELRRRLAAAVKSRREVAGLTQAALASLIQSSQSRVAKMEAASPSVSLDLLLRGYFAVGGELEEIDRVLKAIGKAGEQAGQSMG